MRTYSCLWCGAICTTNRGNQKYCSTHCSQLYRDKLRHPPVAFVQCKFNHAVECSHGDCDRCGWNPEVEKKRKERLG